MLRCAGRSIGAQNEVRPAKVVEVQSVVFDHEGAVHQFADLLRGLRRIDVIDGIERLGRCHVVRHGTYAADARSDLRHLLHRPALYELLETAQLRHLEIGAIDFAGIVEKDLDLAVALQPRDRIDGDAAATILFDRLRPTGSTLSRLELLHRA